MRPELFSDDFDRLSRDAIERLERIEEKVDALGVIFGVVATLYLLISLVRMVICS